MCAYKGRNVRNVRIWKSRVLGGVRSVPFTFTCSHIPCSLPHFFRDLSTHVGSPPESFSAVPPDGGTANYIVGVTVTHRTDERKRIGAAFAKAYLQKKQADGVLSLTEEEEELEEEGEEGEARNQQEDNRARLRLMAHKLDEAEKFIDRLCKIYKDCGVRRYTEAYMDFMYGPPEHKSCSGKKKEKAPLHWCTGKNGKKWKTLKAHNEYHDQSREDDNYAVSLYTEATMLIAENVAPRVIERHLR